MRRHHHRPEEAKNTRPRTPEELWQWVRGLTGVKIARESVCPGHNAPFDAFARQVLERPSVALWLGSRGSGKSFLSAIDTHVTSRFRPRHGTRILGGSLAQSQQIYAALKDVILDGHGNAGNDADSLDKLLESRAAYRNGSTVSILACSSRSVRGPHIPSLKLDEVDEIDADLRESAMGMCMAKGGSPASVLMTSTWHKVGGPMTELIERGESGRFPVYRFCVFEVLERCPASRSGPAVDGPDLFAHCPACPIQKWCHEDVRNGLPKAKRSAGHYTIDSFIQKAETVSPRIIEADYLCKGPKADGIWFRDFDPATHVRESAEYDPAIPVHVSIDSGVFTGCVLGQIRETFAGKAVNIFGDYLSEGMTAEANATQIKELARVLSGGFHRVSTDPAGGARNPIGPTVIAEYERAGLRANRNGIERWPIAPVADGLALIEALLMSGVGSVGLTIHPRCKKLIEAFKSYRRAKRGGQWQDYPADPAHPEEDLMDALRGLVKLEMPEGRKSQPNLRRVAASRVF